VEYAKLALAEKPYLESARLNLWHAWRNLGFSDSVYAAIARRARGNELSRQEKFLLGVTALDLGLPREAISRLHEALEAESRGGQPTYSQAATEPLQLGRLSDADFGGKIYYNLGTAFGLEGMLDSASFYLRAALQLDPDLAEAWVNLGSSHLARNEYEIAKEALLKAVDLGVESEVLHFNLAIAHLALADTAAAINNLQRCLQINPDLERARGFLEQLEEKAGEP
jgi:tetratricopeptide (TPR) repeat protein